MAPSARLTMLTEMMGPDVERAVDALARLGIRHLDLKGGLYGRSIADVGPAERERLATLLERHGVSVWCFSSVLGDVDVAAVPERDFRLRMERGVASLLETARAIPPRMIRLLSCRFPERTAYANSNGWLRKYAPWVYAAYADAADAIAAEGIAVTVENELHGIFSQPDEVLEFFARVDRPGKMHFTWDIQNLWQSGCFPTLEVYHALRPVLNYVHLKGGQSAPDDPLTMRHRSTLADASWPVRAIVGAILADGVSPVLCLNCSHGSPGEDYPLKDLWGTPDLAAEEARRDVAWLRQTFAALE